MNNVSVNIHEVGGVFVAVVEVVGNFAGCWEKDKGAGGNGFRGIPNVGLEEGIFGTTELLDAEVVVVDEALKGFYALLHRTHFDAAPHTVEGHRNHGVAGLPADGSVFGVVGNRPNAGLGLDEGLVSIVVVLGREVVDGGVLVEIVGGVGFAFGDCAVSDVIVGIGNIVCGNELVSDVVTILLVILGGAAAEKVVGVSVDGIGGVGDSGEEVAVGFVTPRDHGLIWIGEFRFEVGTCEVFPLKAIGFGNTACGGVIGNGLLAHAAHRVAHRPSVGVIVAGEGLSIKAVHVLRSKLAEGIIGESGDADGIGGGGLAPHGFVGIGNVGRGVGVVDGEKLTPGVVGVGGDDAAGVGASGEAAGVGVGIGEFIIGD